MADPYTVLGVPFGASQERIDEAYKQKSRAYRESGNYDKLDELNEAYDNIIMGASSGGYSYVGTDFSDIRDKIAAGRLEDAQLLLDGVPFTSRNAEWYYLRGIIYDRKGWLEEARSHYSKASSMDPSNIEYAEACRRVNNARSGGYKTQESKKSSGSGCSCGVCEILEALICADCCCESMGCDIIKCI